MDFEPKLEINNNTWEVKNTQERSLPVLCSFSVNKSESENVYFFEVELLADGNDMLIGWTTRLASFEYSTNYEIMYNLKSFKATDIIGCLINLTENNVLFFHNGNKKEVEVKKSCFDFAPFFATAFLSCNQHIKFNFGKNGFKSNINQNCKTFDLVASKNNIQFSLLQPFNFGQSKRGNIYIFNYLQNNQNKEDFFNDLVQMKVDVLVESIENQITDNFLKINLNFFKNTIKKFDLKQCRVFQSIVEVMGDKKKVNEKNINVFAWYISDILHFCENEKELWTMVLHYLNNLEDFLVDYDYDFIKLGNFCIVLASFYFWEKNRSNLNIPIIKKSCIFLNKVLGYNFDPSFLWVKLFALIALEKHILGKSFIGEIVNEIDDYFANTINFVNKWKNFKIEKNTNALEEQLYLVANSFYNNCHIYLFETEEIKKVKTNNLFEMNKQDKTRLLKLSPSNDIARNDHFKVRSIRSSFDIPAPFYFEVKILTSGCMTIGVASEKMFIGHEVGSNEFSIGFDGFNKCVKFNNQFYEFSNHYSKWEVNDVIGIYFDFREQKVIFLINNKIIKFKENLFKNIKFFNEENIYVAVSLYQFQQCKFVFDCKIPKKLLNKIKPSLKTTVINNKFISSLVMSNSSCSVRDINVTSNVILSMKYNKLNLFLFYF